MWWDIQSHFNSEWSIPLFFFISSGMAIGCWAHAVLWFISNEWPPGQWDWDGWLVLNGKPLALDKVHGAEWIYFSFPQSSTGSALTPILTPITRSPVSDWKIYCHVYFSLSSSEYFCHLQWTESVKDLTKHQSHFQNWAGATHIKITLLKHFCFLKVQEVCLFIVVLLLQVFVINLLKVTAPQRN